jgi:transcriptional regulator with XRE-family HTH domain
VKIGKSEHLGVASKQTRVVRGRRRSSLLVARALQELATVPMTLGVSQRAMAQELGWSQSRLWRMEAGKSDEVSVKALCEMASVLGLEASFGLHPLGDPIRDKGQQALGYRLNARLAPVWRVTNETLLPMPGDLRSWDKLLRLTVEPHQRVGVDLETRIRDIQALVRRTRLRERDGGVDRILLVLSDSATNRRLVDELRDSLGSDYATSTRLLLRGLRAGSPLPGSGVIVI